VFNMQRYRSDVHCPAIIKYGEKAQTARGMANQET